MPDYTFDRAHGQLIGQLLKKGPSPLEAAITKADVTPISQDLAVEEQARLHGKLLAEATAAKVTKNAALTEVFAPRGLSKSRGSQEETLATATDAARKRRERFPWS